MENAKSYEQLLKELEDTQSQLKETRCQLEEANDMIEAIRTGQVDALVIKSDVGHQLYTLESADVIYRIFIEQMTEGAVTLNPEGKILYCNTRFSAWTGLSLEKVIGKSFEDFVHPQNFAQWRDLLAEAWTAGIRGETSLRSVSGRRIPVSISFNVLIVNEGTSMSLILTDETEQKEAQQLLNQQNQQLLKAEETARLLNANLEETVRARTQQLYDKQEQLSRILETMAEGVVIIDNDGNLVYANPMAQGVLGLKASQLENKIYDDPKWQNLRLDGSSLPEEEHPLFIAIRTGKPVYDHEIAVQPPGREIFYISINAAAIRDENGVITGGISTFMDVTNRRKAMQDKDEFISVASHELRTPITSLKASLQLLERMKNKPSAAMLPRLIEQSNVSLNKVSVLIDDLLNATKFNQGLLVLNKTRFKVSTLIDGCISYLRIKGKYQIVAEGDRDIEVNADFNKLEQVLNNLINNAVKYAPASKTILISSEKTAQTVRISVIDKGPGISPDKLPYLFDRYYRVDSGGHQYSGLGLGLYICSEIIKKHKGEIGANSSLGKGSVFWFEIPADPAKIS